MSHAQTIAHYTIERELGRGGMGVVYRALDTRLGRPVAMKSLPGEYINDIRWRTRFEAEAKALAAINHPDTERALACERAFLAVLDGSCRTPIAGHATVLHKKIRFRGMIVKPDGSASFETMRQGDARDAERLGADAGAELKGHAAPDFFMV